MYGAVLNTATGNARLTIGTLTWTLVPASGSPIAVFVCTNASTIVYDPGSTNLPKRFYRLSQ